MRTVSLAPLTVVEKSPFEISDVACACDPGPQASGMIECCERRVFGIAIRTEGVLLSFKIVIREGLLIKVP